LVWFYFPRDPWRIEQDRLGRELSSEISSATEVEIYTLDPARGGGPLGKPGVLPSNEPFGRRTITGRSLVTQAGERRELCDAVVNGLTTAQMMGPECWEPRHALRFRTPAGDRYLVISFHCAHGFVDQKGGESTWFDISKASEAAWDDILSRHGLPVPR
jgi:hypothetical protein